MQRCAERLAAALTTRLLIPRHEMSVLSRVSPSRSLKLLAGGSTVETLARGLALAGLPGVERSLAVFWSG